MATNQPSQIQRRDEVIKLCVDKVQDSAMTLAQHGIDPDVFAGVVREAVLMSPNIIDCTNKSLAVAFRQACRDGLVPDNRQAAIIPYKREAKFLPMKEGLMLIAHQDCGAEIRAGHIRQGDKVTMVDRTGSGEDPTIEIERPTDYFEHPEGELIGCWAWVKFPGQTAHLRTWRKEDIRKAMAASASGDRGAWGAWPHRMAEKAVIKSLLNSLRYMQTSKRLTAILDDDRPQPTGIVIDAKVEEVAEEPVVKPAAAKKEKKEKSEKQKAQAKQAAPPPAEDGDPGPGDQGFFPSDDDETQPDGLTQPAGLTDPDLPESLDRRAQAEPEPEQTESEYDETDL